MQGTTIPVRSKERVLLADTVTPVQAYLRLRDRYPNSILLESADYRGSENSVSYLCCEPVASITLHEGQVLEHGSVIPERRYQCTRGSGLPALLDGFINRFAWERGTAPARVKNGVFGFIGYDAVQYMEDISFRSPVGDLGSLPELHFSAFRYVISFDHFRNEMVVLENSFGDERIPSASLDDLLHTIFHKSFAQYPFGTVGDEKSLVTDEQYCDLVRTCQKHIARGDVFQIVASRRFTREFRGDDFAVYRVLRSINPSPFLFYFDHGDFRIFGSSPEAQILVKNGSAGIYPIAGTYPRSGDDAVDRERVEKLIADPKENSEHSMLVDLARNDLSRSCVDVHVKTLKEIQYYSHVIHLVSHVVGKLAPGRTLGKVMAETFPAGTLSGAPKYKAMELIDAYEPVRRQLYGGCLGFLSFEGEALLAIMIRTYISRARTLIYQAAAGIVFDSVPERETAEVSAKLAALKSAIDRAKEVGL